MSACRRFYQLFPMPGLSDLTADWVVLQLGEVFPEVLPCRYVILDRDAKLTTMGSPPDGDRPVT
jgi:hypothetical protein